MHDAGPDPFASPNVEDGGRPPLAWDDIKRVELGAVRLVGLSFHTVFRRPLTLLVVALVPAVLVQLVNEWVAGSFFVFSVEGVLVATALAQMLGLFTQIGVARIVEDEVNGTSTDAGALARAMIGKWVPLFFTCCVLGVLIALGMAVVLIPGLMLMILGWFVPYVVVLRDSQGTDAIRYSFDLVQGRFWTVVGRIALLLVLFLPVWVSLTAVVAFESYLQTDRLSAILTSIVWLPMGVAWVLMFINLDYCDVEPSDVS